MEKKGLEDERRGRESQGQERTGEPTGGNQQETDLGKQGMWRRGREANPGKRWGGKREGAMASASLRGGKIIRLHSVM